MRVPGDLKKGIQIQIVEMSDYCVDHGGHLFEVSLHEAVRLGSLRLVQILLSRGKP